MAKGEPNERSARHRPSRQTDSQSSPSTRDRLLAGALDLFAEQGYRATTIDQIERAAGLTPRAGALYNHFPSKMALLQAVLDERTRAIEEFGERLELGASLRDLRAELLLIARWGLGELERERLLLQVVSARAIGSPSWRRDFARRSWKRPWSWPAIRSSALPPSAT